MRITTTARLTSLLTIAVVTAGISGCGDSGKKAATTPVPAAAKNLADSKLLHSIPLKTPVSGVVAKIGKPRRITHGKAPARKLHKGKVHMVAVTDYYYGVKGGGPGMIADLTFVQNKLASVLIMGHLSRQ